MQKNNVKHVFVNSSTELTGRVETLEIVTAQLSNATRAQNDKISSTEDNVVSLDEGVSSTEGDIVGLDERVGDLESGGGNGTVTGK